MALFLIKKNDSYTKNKKNCYQKGDIIQVFNNNKNFNYSNESNFWIILVHNMSYNEAILLSLPKFRINNNNIKPIIRRAYFFDINKLDTQTKLNLDKGFITLSKENFLKYIVEKNDNN